tara:strand:- start:2751 stop:2978 length:228 start_codon:yes stop_codon:yes gene_type:complete
MADNGNSVEVKNGLEIGNEVVPAGNGEPHTLVGGKRKRSGKSKKKSAARKMKKNKSMKKKKTAKRVKKAKKRGKK